MEPGAKGTRWQIRTSITYMLFGDNGFFSSVLNDESKFSRVLFVEAREGLWRTIGKVYFGDM